MQKLRFKPADYIIIGLMVIAGLVGLWYNVQQGGRMQQKYVTVYVDNKMVAELSLGDSDRFQYTFPFGEAGQYQAVIEVEGGRVRILEMGSDLCPKAICSHTGWIVHTYQSIVCLPNRIMIVFREDASAEDAVDGVTY